jgi:hypothetical protein
LTRSAFILFSHGTVAPRSKRPNYQGDNAGRVKRVHTVKKAPLLTRSFTKTSFNKIRNVPKGLYVSEAMEALSIVNNGRERKVGMASSLCFNPEVKGILPIEMLDKLRIIPLSVKEDKLCLIARRPLSDEALLELKSITGYEDYELQLVGDDVLGAYIEMFKDGSLFIALQ